MSKRDDWMHSPTPWGVVVSGPHGLFTDYWKTEHGHKVWVDWSSGYPVWKKK